MAYEVEYTYFERMDDGNYNTEVSKTFTKRYGKRHEEVPLERVANTVIQQLSRRDIWITDVKIHQFVKRPVSFREVKGGGIVIGNKKFHLDQTQTLLAEDEETPPPPLSLPQRPIPVAQAVPNIQGKPPLRWVIFNPPAELRQQARALQLTVGNRYPLYEEKVTGTTNASGQGISTTAQIMSYLIADDLRRSVWAMSYYFEDAVQLAFENEMVGGSRPDNVQFAQSFVDSVEYTTGEHLELRR